MHREKLVSFLQQALILAASREGFCAPNPAVGAVIVRDQKVIANGCHWQAGCAHAEIDALQKIDFQAQGATLLVTLEPCCHYGKTPPCVKAIIESGISQVYFAVKDVNPAVSGGGQKQLQQAGIGCEQVAVAEIDRFYQPYRYWWQHKRPWVNLKIALSKDNKFAGKGGVPVVITGLAAQQYTHQWRRRCDAILTTAATIIADDPQLSVRLDDQIIKKPLIILDTHCRLPLSAQVFKTTEKIILFHGVDAEDHAKGALQAKGVQCIAVSSVADGLDLSQVLREIGQLGYYAVWTEVGAHCFTNLISQQLANRILVYRSAKCLGADALDSKVNDELFLGYQQNVLPALGEDEVFEYVLNHLQ